jgi:hypothetical protein
MLLASGCASDFEAPPSVILPVEPAGVVALAGPDLVVLEGSRVALAGRGSRAVAGEPLLSWSQVGGSPVLLTNPSSPLPVFVAPLAPARLVFELRAEAAGAVDTDEVAISVVNANGTSSFGPAGFIDIPGDAVAEPLSAQTFRVGVKSAVAPVAFTARARCGEGTVLTLTPAGDETADIAVTLPRSLPCAVVVDGIDDDGQGIAPAARVFWPPATPVPAATNISADFNVEPGGTAILEFDGTATGGRAWSVDGTDDVLPGGVDGVVIPISVPRRAQRLVIAGEAMLATGRSGSGGIEYEFIDVSAGSGNIAPRANGGPDRVVQPGGRFRLDTSGSFDLDVDPIAVTTEQVLGPSAAPDRLLSGAFQAPTVAGVLLFHVVADDGAVQSAPDPVRVVVDTNAENLPPVLVLPTTRYAIPGETFTVDGSSAEDPDSGFVALITIAQHDGDDVILLANPLNEARVELVAGAALDVYRFLISAYDEDGLGVTVEQTIVVEEAGPYVDAVRGDADGNGTAALPFASVAEALATAVRHDLPELLLAVGNHAPIGVVLPPRVSLRGGFVFDGVGYNEDTSALDLAAATMLPVTNEGIGLVDASATALTFRLDGAAGSVALYGGSSLERARVVDGLDHSAPLVIVRSLAAARIDDVDVEPAGTATPATVVVEAGATARLLDARVHGALGAEAVGISCTAATVSLEASNIVGAAGADIGTGVRARSGCALDVTASIVSGGETPAGTGLDAEATLLTADAATTIAGTSGNAGTAVAVRFVGRQRSALIRSTLLGTGDVATGLLCDDAQVSLVGAIIKAQGTLSVAVQPDGCVLASRDAVLTAETAGLRGTLADDVNVAGGSIEAGGAGIDLDGEGVRSFRDLIIRATGVGLRALDAVVELDTVDLRVDGDGDDALGVAARGVSARDSQVSVSGVNARAMAIGDSTSIIERSAIHATGARGIAISHVGPLSLLSSLVTTSSPDIDATGVFSEGLLLLRHATIVTAGAALHVLLDATLDAANSVLAGTPGIETEGAPWTQAVALAFSSTLTPLVTQPGVSVTTGEALEDLGCEACLMVDVSRLVDADGHLLQGDNPLVDAGDDALSVADDIDGEPRPQGNATDVGCDERTP